MAVALSDDAKRIISEGGTRVRVRRAGMLQFQEFKIRRVPIGGASFVELWLDRVIDTSELIRLANELRLPVEAQNGRVFPDGLGAKDFVGL
ncbi:MAG: hypothetical protein M1474_02055 [Candidatus Marsarchaeota archaeon]|nr:hypothetical protein [Candidatus Marsarchaeota archaeon]